MKSLAIALVAISAFVTVAASADIPLPHNPEKQTESRSQTFSGAKAESEWNHISTPVIRGSVSGWSGQATSYKVDRSEDGLDQTVCSQVVNMRTKMAPVFSCTKEESLDGKPLPKFVPVIAMG